MMKKEAILKSSQKENLNMIEVRYRDQLGNNLFQYCFGRILAEELGYKLLAEPIPGFPNTNDPIEGKEYTSPVEYIGGHVVDFHSLLRNKEPRKIIVDGYFQRYEYYKPYKRRIKEWLETVNTNRKYRISQNDFVVHIRGRDFRIPKPGRGYIRAVPFSWYQNILDVNTWDNLYVVTDDPEYQLTQKFVSRYKAKIHSFDVIEDFNFIKSVNKIALSASSFSWWAAWLSEAKQIYIPQVGDWDSRLRSNIDLIVDDEKRYQYIRWPKSSVALKVLTVVNRMNHRKIRQLISKTKKVKCRN